MDVIIKHQVKIAISTLEMSKVGASIMGGMDHKEAVAVLRNHGMSDVLIRLNLLKAGHSEEDIKEFMQ